MRVGIGSRSYPQAINILADLSKTDEPGVFKGTVINGLWEFFWDTNQRTLVVIKPAHFGGPEEIRAVDWVILWRGPILGAGYGEQIEYIESMLKKPTIVRQLILLKYRILTLTKRLKDAKNALLDSWEDVKKAFNNGYVRRGERGPWEDDIPF